MSTPRRALILIDVQQQYFSGPLEIQYPPHQESLPMIAKAIDAATAAGIFVAVIQHSAGEGAPVFAPGTPGFELHPEIERRKTGAWKSLVKQYGSVYAEALAIRKALTRSDLGSSAVAGMELVPQA